ncbi:MAG: hypothetical protein PHX83_06605 [Acidobacteriia bacterium]|nr:hypothetical protein [Terriglobia bacterium]
MDAEKFRRIMNGLADQLEAALHDEPLTVHETRVARQTQDQMLSSVGEWMRAQKMGELEAENAELRNERDNALECINRNTQRIVDAGIGCKPNDESYLLTASVTLALKEIEDLRTSLAGWVASHSPGPMPECVTITDAPIDARWVNSDGTPYVVDMGEVPAPFTVVETTNRTCRDCEHWRGESMYVGSPCEAGQEPGSAPTCSGYAEVTTAK